MDLQTIGDMPLMARFCHESAAIDKTLINERSTEGQAYKLSLLDGRWCVIVAIGPELTKLPQYLHLVQGKGFGKLFVVECAENELAKQLVAQSEGKIEHIPCDLTNRPTLTEDVAQCIDSHVRATARRHLIEGLPMPPQFGNETEGLVSALFTIWDDAVCLVSRLQRCLGGFGDGPEVIDVCHDKLLARRALERAGVRGPANRRIASLEDAKTFGRELRYPLILKPVNGAASIGIYKMESYEQLVSEFQSCQEAMDKIYQDEELMGLTFQDGPEDAPKGYEDLRTFVAEEFIGGKEYDCDIVLFDGECVYANINEDWNFKPGWMCERGMHHPASLNKEDYRTLWTAAANYAKAIGCTRGIFHVEMKWDPDMGPQMIECNPRMGGQAVWQLHRNCWGVDLLFELALCFTNIPSRPILLDEPLGLGVSLLLFSDKGGVAREDLQSYNETRIVSEYGNVKDGGVVDYLCLPARKGDVINGWEGVDFPTHMGRLDLFYPADRFPIKEEAIALGKSMRKNVIIPLESGDHADEW